MADAGLMRIDAALHWWGERTETLRTLAVSVTALFHFNFESF